MTLNEREKKTCSRCDLKAGRQVGRTILMIWLAGAVAPRHFDAKRSLINALPQPLPVLQHSEEVSRHSFSLLLD